MSDSDTWRSHDAPSPEDEAFFRDKKAKRKARRQRRDAAGPAERELNLTAMMDILTILVVFLLKNYTNTPAANLTKDLNPPISKSQIEMTEAITVSVTRHDISVDDEKVVGLDNGKVLVRDRTVTEEPLLIGPLRDSLMAKVAYHKRIEQMGGSPFKGEMLVVGDRSIDYQLLSMILYSAGQAQLANFRFVTIAP